MKSFSFIHTADLHLDSPFSGLWIEDCGFKNKKSGVRIQKANIPLWERLSSRDLAI